MPSVDDSIQFVKGIGPKKAKLLEKLHIRTLRDALETYPRDYEDRTHITPIAEIDMEDKYAVRAVVGTEPKVNRIRKGLTLVKCTIYDETGTLNVTYFNNPYAAAQLHVGQEYVFYGKVQGYRTRPHNGFPAVREGRTGRRPPGTHRAGLSADSGTDPARS